MPLNLGTFRYLVEVEVELPADEKVKPHGRTSSMTSFTDLSLSPELRAALVEHGWTPPSEDVA